MSNISTVVICIILAIIAFWGIHSAIRRASQGCCGGCDPVKKIKTDKNILHYQYKYTMYIDGMHCSNFVKSVENALNGLGGIYAKADLAASSAVVYAKRETDEDTLTDAVNKIGFSAYNVQSAQ